MPQIIPAIVSYGVQAATVGVLGTIGSGIAGAIAGGLVASALAPTQKSEGPRLGDLRVQSSAYGTVIPYVLGGPRIAGQVIWASTIREIKHVEESGGKGGGGQESTTYTYEVDLLILLTENVQSAISRVWVNGGLVWNKSSTADPATVAASDNIPQWTSITFYGGDASQLPDPIYEAAVGSVNASANRGRATAMIQSLQLGSSNNIPNITFEFSEELTVSLGTEYFSSNSAYNIQGARVEDDRALIVWQNAGADLRGRIMREGGINAVNSISFNNVQQDDILALTATTFLTAYIDVTGTPIKGCVLTTSGSPATSFSAATEYTLDASAAASGSRPFLGTISATQSILISTGTTSGQLRGQVVGIAGTVLTAGTITAFASGIAGLTVAEFAMLSATQGIALCTVSSTLYVVTVVVSGTTVTFGTPALVPLTGSVGYVAMARTSASSAVAAYKVGSTEVRSFTVSAGGSVSGLTTILTGNFDWLSLGALNSSVLLLSYNLTGIGIVRAVPLNSGGLIAGADIAVSASGGERSNVIPISSTKAIVAWRSGTAPFNVTYNTVTVE